MELLEVGLPKKVIIGGQEWRIKANKKYGGAKFWGGRKLIEIGTKYKGDIANNFLHEIIEAILSERNHRYEIYGGMDGNENFLFNFTHEQFRNIIFDIGLALKDVLK